MKTYIDIFSENKIELYAALPFSDCRVTRSYLYEREKDFVPKSVLLFLVPYYTGTPENISAYAASGDYHLFMQSLFRELLPVLAQEFEGYRFLGFSDHSPIDERHAAAAAGLGILGDNGLLITEQYSSYVFIGEVVSELPPERLSAAFAHEPRGCLHCGACRLACPSGALRKEGAPCLSAVTQKKGALTAEDRALLKSGGSVWGCDCCTAVCPYTKEAERRGTIMTPIRFFYEDSLACMTEKLLSSMSDEAFRRYAFSWRGREVLLRNIKILEEKKKSSST